MAGKTRQATNSDLTKAKSAKNDEFYTQYIDIEKEMNAYLEYNENEFKSKSDGKLYHSGWYHIDGVVPLGIIPTHWMKLELP